MKILISGASGFVGKYVLDLLLKQGHEVHALTRHPEKHQELYPAVNWIRWNDCRHIADLSSIQSLDGVINLVGENLALKRWNNTQKKVIFNSRIDGTRTIFKMLKAAGLEPKTFVSTSAIGIYGDKGTDCVSEDSDFSEDFLGNLCQAWENAAAEGSKHLDRTVIIRTGIVLGKGGGVAQSLSPIFKLGLGGKLGNGNFYMSWIHVKDLARIYVKALEDLSMNGVYNAVAPFPVTNGEFTRVMGNTVRKPTPFNVPKLLLRVVMGEFAEYITKSAKVLPTKLKADNFHYLYPTIEVAVKDVVSKA